MKKAILFLLTLLLSVTAQAQQHDQLGELQSGDLLFLTKNKSAMEKAITASTGEYTHVALVERDSADDVWVFFWFASGKKFVQRNCFEFAVFIRCHYIGFIVFNRAERCFSKTCG